MTAALCAAAAYASGAGLCDISPDFSPILGVTEVDGFLVSAGWGTYGFKAAPIVGTTLAELVATKRTPALIAPFALERFRPIRSSPSWPRRPSPTDDRDRYALQPRDRAGRAAPADRASSRRTPACSRRGRAIRPAQGEARSLGARTARGQARREADLRHGDHADEGRRGQDDDVGRAHPGPRRDRQEPGALPARGLGRARLRDQGRRGRRRLRAGRADGGPEPPLHGRPPRDRRREQPARRDPRVAPPPRERARDRPALDQLAPLRGHERPRAPADRRSGSAAARTATSARPASTSPRPRR